MTRKPHMLSNEKATPGRSDMVKKVHVGRRQLGLDDVTYRALLQRVTGHVSSTACSVGQLHDVLAEMKRLGFKASRPNHKPWVRKVYALWREMKPMLRGDGSTEALRAFVERCVSVSAPEFLDEPQARKVIEALKAWKSRMEKGTVSHG